MSRGRMVLAHCRGGHGGLFNFGRDTATRIEVHDAVGAAQVKLGSSTGEAHLNIVYLEPGGLLGEHPAPTPQLFIVVDGNGWVSGDDGYRHTVSAGVGVFWSEGERHASGTDTGLSAVIMQARQLDVVAPSGSV